MAYKQCTEPTTTYQIEKDICFEYADVISINNYPGWIGNTPDWTKPSFDYIRPMLHFRIILLSIFMYLTIW